MNGVGEMNRCLMRYDIISIEMLELLTEFSDHINQISNLNDVLLTEDFFNCNQNFKCYIDYFGIGRYYHFRCMGYMEALVLTKCYSVKSLCYWKNKLVMPADENITLALEYLDQVKEDYGVWCNPIFRELILETKELMEVAMEIMDTIMCYNLPC